MSRRREAKRCNKICALFHINICNEVWEIDKNGKRIVLETSGVPLFDDNGDFKGFQGIDRDITKRKEIEKALIKSKQELELRVAKRTLELQKTK